MNTYTLTDEEMELIEEHRAVRKKSTQILYDRQELGKVELSHIEVIRAIKMLNKCNMFNEEQIVDLIISW